MAKSSRFYYNTRYILPIMIGIIVGFALSLLCTPFYYCESSLNFGFFNFNSSKLSLKQFSKAQQEQFRLNILEQQRQIDDFEPRINLEGKPKRPQKAVQKLVRPRHASTELKIRSKLFVGILSTDHSLSPFASFLNQSFAKCSNKPTFFVNNADMSEKMLFESTPPGINVVNFNDNRDHLLAFHSLKYVIDNYIEMFDWFFFVTDDTYVRSSKLLDLVNHISISRDLYMGHIANPTKSIYCSLNSGIIFSNGVLRKLLVNLEWCIKNSYSENPSENIGRCVLHSSNLACTNSANGRKASFYQNSNFEFDSTIDQLIYSPDFNESITVNKISDIKTMKQLELYFDAVEMDKIDSYITDIEKNIMDIVCETPDGCESLIWPLGVSAPYKPKSRHEVIRWDYFNRTHIFLGNDFETIEELTEYFKSDIEELITFAIKYLNAKSSNQFKFERLLNGYKQLDPTRGTAYILDLLLYDTHLFSNIHKRLDFMRPLGNVEIIPMPYVTEAHKINLIVPFSIEYNPRDVDAFFAHYERSILSHKDITERVNLVVVYLSADHALYRQEEFQTFAYVSGKLKDLSKRYSSLLTSSPKRLIEAKVTLANLSLYFSEGYRQLSIVEQITHNISSDGLILLGSPCMQIKAEFLNRVCLNTIKGAQVFFPVPFSEYAPKIVYPPNKTLDDEIEINKFYGYFNSYSFGFVSFYNQDFQTSRKNFLFAKATAYGQPILTNINLNDHVTDLYDLFTATTTSSSVHVLRATDQALKCKWRLDERCSSYEKIDNGEKERCLRQRETSLGTKAQLAMHLMKNYEKLV